MRPIDFPGRNVIFAEDQPEYRPLPAHRAEDGRITSCWALTWRERFVLLLSGKLYLSALTFNRPPQPLLPSVQRYIHA